MSLSKFAVNSLKRKFLFNLVSAGEFAIQTDESTDEAGRSQLATHLCYIDSITYNPIEEYVSIRKLATAKMSKAIVTELETMFHEKNMDKKTCFFGLDGTNAMSNKKKGLQRCIIHVSPFAVFMNCW